MNRLISGISKISKENINSANFNIELHIVVNWKTLWQKNPHGFKTVNSRKEYNTTEVPDPFKHYTCITHKYKAIHRESEIEKKKIYKWCRLCVCFFYS